MNSRTILGKRCATDCVTLRNKRHRGSKSAPELPRDVLRIIVKQIDSDDLLSVAQVCRSWRSAADERWEELCARSNISTVATRKAASKVAQIPPPTGKSTKQQCKRYETAWRRSVCAYRKAYLRVRHTICRHCLRAYQRHYELYDMTLCWECRRLEPYAWIRRSTASHHFGIRPSLAGCKLRTMPCTKSYGVEKQGPLYRFQDMVDIATNAYGEESANKCADELREMLGIGKMEGTHVHQI